MIDINVIIIFIMAVFVLLGALDRILVQVNEKWKIPVISGMGARFEDGFNAMGPLALAMVGVISLAPVLANILRPVVVPVYGFLLADPAMFATTLLANDMGGYPLAMKLALTEDAGRYAGLILGAMMGPPIVFTIPVALGIIRREDRPLLARGILAGMVTIPLGCIAGGFTAGFGADVVLGNLIPIILASALIAFGLWRIPERMTRGFLIFGRYVVVMITIGLGAAVFQHLTGIVLIPGLDPVFSYPDPVGGIEVIGLIGVMLLGAFPLVFFLTNVLKRPLLALGRAVGMSETDAAGMVATLANNIPMFAIFKDMTERGKVLNAAFAVSAAFTFGDHLGFTAGVDREMIFAMIVGKLVAGITAVAVAMFLAAPKARATGNEAEIRG